MKLVIKLEDNLWALKDGNDYYDSIHDTLPPELYSEVFESSQNFTLRYWPLYFPIGLLIKFMRDNGYGVEIIY